MFTEICAFLKSSKYSFEVLQDPRMDVFKKFGGGVMPFVVLADNEGFVTNKHVGYNLGDEKALEQEIRELISFKEDTLKKD